MQKTQEPEPSLGRPHCDARFSPFPPRFHPLPPPAAPPSSRRSWGGASGGRVAPGLVGVRGLGRAREPREGCHVRHEIDGSFASPRFDDGDRKFAVFRGACALGVGVLPGMRRPGGAVAVDCRLWSRCRDGCFGLRNGVDARTHNAHPRAHCCRLRVVRARCDNSPGHAAC